VRDTRKLSEIFDDLDLGFTVELISLLFVCQN